MVRNSPSISEEFISAVIQLAPYAEISHHIPGRICLNISLAAQDRLEATTISRTICSLPGVISHRVNLHAGSVVIDYDRSLIPYDLWELLGQVRGRPELAPVAGKLMRMLWQ